MENGKVETFGNGPEIGLSIAENRLFNDRLFQALVGNVGTCRFDDKGEIRRSRPPKEKSTEAKHRDGAACSSYETIEKSWSKGAASFSRCHGSTQVGRNL